MGGEVSVVLLQLLADHHEAIKGVMAVIEVLQHHVDGLLGFGETGLHLGHGHGTGGAAVDCDSSLDAQAHLPRLISAQRAALVGEHAPAQVALKLTTVLVVEVGLRGACRAAPAATTYPTAAAAAAALVEAIAGGATGRRRDEGWQVARENDCR